MAKKIKSKQIETVKKVTGAVTLNSPEFLYVDTTAGSATITLPASPFTDDHVRVYSFQNTLSSSNTITINPNGKAINGNTSNQVLSRIQNKYVDYIYDGFEWKAFDVDPSSVYFQNTAPNANNSIAGDFWWDDVNLKLNILHDDGTAKTWVDVTGASSNTTGLQVIGQYHANTDTRYDLFGNLVAGGLPLPTSVPVGTAFLINDAGVDAANWALSRPGQATFGAVEGDYIVNDGSQFKWLPSQLYSTGSGDVVRSDNGIAPTRSSTYRSNQTGDMWIDTARDKIYMHDRAAGPAVWLPIGNTYSTVDTAANVPAFPKKGDFHYDTTNSVLKVYDGASWLSASSAPALNIVGGWQNSPGPSITDFKGNITGMLPAPNTLAPGTAYFTMKNANSTNWGLSGVPFTNTTPVDVTVGDLLYSDGGSFHVIRLNDVNQGSGDTTYNTTGVAPTTRTTGHPLQGGDFWFDGMFNMVYIYDAASSSFVSFFGGGRTFSVTDSTIYNMVDDEDVFVQASSGNALVTAPVAPVDGSWFRLYVGPIAGSNKIDLVSGGAGDFEYDGNFYPFGFSFPAFGTDVQYVDCVWNSRTLRWQTYMAFERSNGFPDGANTEVQFNNSGAFGANSNFTFNVSTLTLSSANVAVPNRLTANVFVANAVTGTAGQVLTSNSVGGVYWGPGSSNIQAGLLTARPATPTSDTIYIINGDGAGINGRAYAYDTGTATWFSLDTKATDAGILGNTANPASYSLGKDINKHVVAISTGGVQNFYLPSSPVDGEVHHIYSGARGTGNVIVSGNTENIDGSASYTLLPSDKGATFVYDNVSAEWKAIPYSSSSGAAFDIQTGFLSARPAAPTTDTVYIVNGDTTTAYNNRVTFYDTAAAKWFDVSTKAMDAVSIGNGANQTLNLTTFKHVIVHTDLSAATVNLPTAPVDGQIHYVFSGDRSSGSNITVNGNGNMIEGSLSYTITPTDPGAFFVFSTHTNRWEVVPLSSGGTPAGSTTQIQFNNAGAFGANANFTFAQANSTLTVSGNTVVTGTATFNDITSTGRTTQSIDNLASGVINCASGNLFKISIGASTTFSFTNVPASGTGYMCTLELKLTAAVAATWPAAVKWPSNLAPTLVNGKSYLIMFYTNDGGTNWFGSALPDYSV